MDERTQRTRKRLLLCAIHKSSSMKILPAAVDPSAMPWGEQGRLPFACTGSAVPEHITMTHWDPTCRFMSTSRLHTPHRIFCSGLPFPNTNPSVIQWISLHWDLSTSKHFTWYQPGRTCYPLPPGAFSPWGQAGTLEHCLIPLPTLAACLLVATHWPPQ